jgi:hypothetical protein
MLCCLRKIGEIKGLWFAERKMKAFVFANQSCWLLKGFVVWEEF